MIMTISSYHQKYSSHSDAEIAARAQEKFNELQTVLEVIPLNSKSDLVEIAVLGCGDKRYVQHHKNIFESLLNKPTNIITFDIVTEHLKGEKNIVQHDVTHPLPSGPYDLVFSHILLKFIKTELQLDVLINSFEALNEGGLAIHILNKEDYQNTEKKLSDGLYSVPLNMWKERLESDLVELKCVQEVDLKYGKAFVLEKQKK